MFSAICSTSRCADLECIYTQLTSFKAKKMAILLEAVESSYYPAFANMLQDVLAGNTTVFMSYCFTIYSIFIFSLTLIVSPALEEAKDICTYLKPLQRLFEDMENVEFPGFRGQIAPLMHTVCLVWAHSRYYNRPARLIVLLQETCNLFIHQVNSVFFSSSNSGALESISVAK